MQRLAEAEACESNPWLCDDLRIARLTVHHAAMGDAKICGPHVLATYEVLGVHPEKVWPKIEARRKALGPLQDVAAKKKPPQSVKLWCEKTNAAKVISFRGGETLLRDNTISVPMAAPSIAALYPNPASQSSAKKAEYSLAELKLIVGYSGAPDPICALTLSALRARGEWPNQKGPATTTLSVAILGMMFEGVCCRSTVQRRIKRAVQLGYWRRVAEANSWTDCPKCQTERKGAKCASCGYRGRSKNEKNEWTGEFMRVPVYEFDVQKFRSAVRCREIRHFDARTYAEYKAAAKRGEHPNVTEMPRPKAPEGDPPPKSPAPARPQEPVRKTAEHQRQERRVQPKLSKTEAVKFIANVEQRRRGRTSFFSPADKLMIALHPGEEGYLAPTTFEAAFAAECEAWRREPDVVREALKFYGFTLRE